jgi:hypothetical protein
MPEENMDKGTLSSSNIRNIGSPELWVTPVIGLVLLGGLVYHWRLQLAEFAGPASANDWRIQLKANVGLEIVIGIIPLFAAAVFQRLLRGWNWHGWIQGLAGGLIGSLIVGAFYYYALYPLPHWFKPYDEGEGNVMEIYTSDIFGLALLGGIAVFASFLVVSMATQRHRKSSEA